MGNYHAPLDLVRERSAERPVALARPGVVAVAAQWFQANFKGDVFYAVKANPSPWVIETLWANGVRAFDVASIPEIQLVRAHAPEAKLAYMHPVKSRAAIARAYHEFGVRTFALDTHEELAKILEETGGARDLNLIVRMAVSTDGAKYTLGGKFGVSEAEAPELLRAARAATAELMGVSFHVGSQCMNPFAYKAAMAQVSRALKRAAVFADVIDVGGGFPSIYPGMQPPALSVYMDAIHSAFEEMPVHETTELWCEPGRALVAEASSVLARVELRKGAALYLNEGSYGSMFDAAHCKWPFPVKAVRAHDRDSGEDGAVQAFEFFGPTCDSIDHMPGPFHLPADIGEGDHVEIGMLGAYGVAMATRFNGFGELETVFVDDAPMASLYGLTPTEPQAAPAVAEPTVVKLSSRSRRRRRRK